MDIFFRSKKLQKICNNQKDMLRALGEKRSKKLQQRLLELGAASTLAEISRVPPPRCHELTGDRDGQLCVDLGHPYRLIFIPADDPIPKRADGGLDWDRVKSVEILEITDTH